MKSILTLVLAVLALLGARPQMAYACTCVQLYDTCKSLTASAAIFEATVERIEMTSRQLDAGLTSGQIITERLKRVTLREVKPWRGAAATSVITAADSAACGYDFKIGERYLIVADADAGGGLAVSRCSLTRPVAEAAGILEYLQRAAASGAARPIAVWGQVTRASRWTDFEREYAPVPGALLTLRGPTQRVIVAGADGRYSVFDLPPGKYTVTATPPPNAPQLGAMTSLEVDVPGEPGNACSEVDFIAPILSEISGTVTNERGEPLGGAFVELRLGDQRDFSRGSPGQGFTTDAQGRYRFHDLPPGRYEVGISLRPLPDERAPIYATTEGGQRVIVLPLGGKIALAPIRLRR